MIRVIVTDPDHRRWVHVFPASTRVITVGRGSENVIQIHDPRSSRRQLVIRRAGSIWKAEDAGGRGGTKLNGLRLDRPTRLSRDDEVSFGGSLLELVDTTEPTGSSLTGGETWSGHAVSESREEIHLTTTSPAFRDAIDLARRVAATDETVLVRGETGTGKEVFARLIHEMSPRSAGPLVVVNCPGLSESLFESELFGVEKGVATGVDPRPGRLAQADGGTVLLDEIGDLSAPSQAKLLRFLQDKKVDRVGGKAPIAVDVRVVAATNVDLEESIAEGRFRSDLYHRLAAFEIVLPPLRERREDIPDLVRHFLSRNGIPSRMTAEAVAVLQEHDFPGNVRELELLVRKTAILSRGGEVEPDDLPERIRRPTASSSPTPTRRAGGDVADSLYDRVVVEGADFWSVVRGPFLSRELSRQPIQALVARALSEGGGSYSGAARLLGVSGEYRKFVDFLRHNRLRPEDG